MTPVSPLGKRCTSIAALIAVGAALFLGGACKRKPTVAPDVIARIGDRLVTLPDFKRYLERNAGTDLSQMTAEVASALLDQYIEEVLIAEYAAAHGTEIPAEKIATSVRNDPGSTVIEKRDEMRRAKLIGELSADLPPATDAQISDYYQQHRADFNTGEEVRVKQILLHDENLANQLAQRLHAGASFEELSAEFSLAANARKGGDIGYVSRGELPKIFEDEIFSLKPGSISKVIQTDSTYHLFKVDDRRQPGTVDLQTAAPVIRERLKDDAMRQQLAELIARSRSEIITTVLTKRLPFKYSGALAKSSDE
jgi:parvulin-like peptidyl-prolyl isomerase